MGQTSRIPFSQLPPSQPKLIIIKESDRIIDGNYNIEGVQILSFEFEIPIGGKLKVNSRQRSDGRQSLTIRVWVSKKPNDIELFNRFHPGNGGIHHLFVDENLDPLPEPEIFQIERNQFTAFNFAIGENLIALPPGKYYYNVINLEGFPGGFFVNFVNPDIF